MITTEFDAVISGAGISFASPSELPGAEGLKRQAWKSLADSLGLWNDKWLQEVEENLAISIKEGEGIRLEEFFAVLGGADLLNVLVLNYQVLASTAYNVNHAALADLNLGRAFTFNIDTLLATAGSNSRQLHGRWDCPETIRTTIRSYLSGFSSDDEEAFSAAVAGQKLLVIGYGGRDRDFISAMRRYPPVCVTWVAPEKVLYEDVRKLRDELAQNPDFKFEHVPKTAEVYLSERLEAVGIARRDSGTELSANTHPDPLRKLRIELHKTNRNVRLLAVVARRVLW